jgi:vancomycin resistance protein VanJ
MASFTVVCECGERFHGDDGSVGRRVRCRHCGRTVELTPPRVAADPSVRREPGSKGHRRRRSRAARLERQIATLFDARIATPFKARIATPFKARLATLRARRRRRFRSAGSPHRRPTMRLGRVLRALAWAYLAATVAIALAMWTLGDRWWLATFLVFMGRWVFLLPLVALVPAALWLRPKLLIPLALGAVVTLGPIMGARVGWRRLRPSAEGMPLRVVTFNVDGGRVFASELPLLLDEWKPDVVLFQECGEELAAATEHIAGWHAHHAGQLCMLTRFPIASAEPMDRGALERVRQDPRAGIGGAGYVVRYRLATPSGTVGVVNLHLETPRKGFEGLMSGDVEKLRLNTTLRDLESSLARRFVDATREPTIVAGDFNTPVESRIFQDHWGDLTDAFSRVGTGFGTTKYNGWIRVRIDHVLADAAWWRVARARVGNDLGSDHRPLIADLVLVER